MAMFIVKPWYRKKDDAIYGAEWAGGSDPSWVRTDAAVGFASPNPYYSGMSTTPSSPFDNIMPWAGMRRVTDASAGELVEIPKFYYKWTRNGSAMKLQISMTAFDGSYVSPAHADRGDGVGERDYVYIGRYHCASDYKSKTGVSPKQGYYADFISNVHNLSSYTNVQDYAIRWTILMLYLVEYANWNSQAMIGDGGGSLVNSGLTDTMPYHTGTMKSNRTTSGAGIQYRYVEDLWANGHEFLSGIIIDNSGHFRIINNPNDLNNYTDTSKSIDTGIVASGSSGYIKSWSNNSSITHLEYFIYPTQGGGSGKTYVTDYHSSMGTNQVIMTGGAVNASPNDISGLFLFVNQSWASSGDARGTRLMVLPPSRLSA